MKRCEIRKLREIKVLQAIYDLTEQYGVPPTYREVGAEVGLRSSQTIQNYICALREAGYISTAKKVKGVGTPRNIALTEKGRIKLGLGERSELKNLIEQLHALDVQMLDVKERERLLKVCRDVYFKIRQRK